MRVLRVLVPALILAVVVAVGVVYLTARPDLRDSEHSVDRAWSPLASQLGTRYTTLATTDEQLRKLTGPVRNLADQVNAAYVAWLSARNKADIAAQVRAANSLERLGRRLVTAAQQSERVKANASLLSDVNAYATDRFFANPQVLTGIDTYNKAVLSYERERRGPVRGIVATMLGQDDIPAFAAAPA